MCRAAAIDPDSNSSRPSDETVVGHTVPIGPDGAVITIAGELRAFADAACDVVVDFTVAPAARMTLPWLAMHGMHAVVGHHRVRRRRLRRFRAAFGDGRRTA